jgi:putative colanic acid biosysnthesis UDP-glucose lipid carrier transferase
MPSTVDGRALLSTEVRENSRINPFQPDRQALVRMLIDPAVAVAMLLLAAWWFEGSMSAPWVILALLVFALTFPGRTAAVMPMSTRLVAEIVRHWSVLVAVLLLLGWATQTLGLFEWEALLAWVLVTPVALLVAHTLMPAVLARVLATPGARRTAVIVGSSATGMMLGRRIQENPYLGMRIVGYFDDRTGERIAGIPQDQLLGPLAELAEFVKQRHIDLIYCALPMNSQPRIRALLNELQDTTASIYFVPDMLSFDAMQSRLDAVCGLPVIAMCESPFCGVNAVYKRASDLVLSIAILIALSPLLLLIAIGVKVGSPGPVLFKQHRYGVDGREILVYKFRTMTCLDDGAVVEQTQRDDPRVTGFGRFLRRYSLDELPQFINVLQGNMSIVGPRPHAVAHNEMYRKLISGYMMRHKVKPGITGLAQVSGFRGETDTLEKMRGRVELDLQYLRNWSPLLDLKILLKTVSTVLGGKNAY